MFSTKKNKKHSKPSKSANLGLLLTIGLIIFILLIFSVFIGRHLESTHYPKINRLETVKLDITISHLQIEEGGVLVDSTFNNPHILEAKRFVEDLLSSSWVDYFLPLAAAKYQKDIKDVLQKIDKFGSLLKSYKYTNENKIKHDAAYFDLVISVEKLQGALQNVYLKQTNTLHTIQRINLLLFVIYLAFVYYVVKRYNRLRKTFIETQEERLREKEIAHYFLEESQNLSKLGYYTYDFKNSRWQASKTITDILGLKEQEGFLKAWIALIHPEDRHILSDVLSKRLKDPGIPLNVTYRLIRPKDGKTLWIHHMAQDIKLDSKGKKLPVLGVIQDITEHRVVVNTLMLREKELITVVESIEDVLYFIAVEPNGKYVFKNVNSSFLNATGLKEEQVIGKSIEQVIPKSSLKMVRDNYRKAIREKTIIKWEEESLYPTGLKSGIVSISPIFDAKGNCTYLVGAVHDITDRKKAEDALRAKEELYRSVFENAPLGIFHFNAQGIVTECNDEFARMVGSSYEKLIGLEMFKKLSDKKMVAAVKETLEKGVGYYEENYTSVTGHKTTPLVIHFKAIYGVDKKVIGGVGLVEDVTERFELHRSLVKSEKDLLNSQKIAQLGTYNLNLVTKKFRSSNIFDTIVGLKSTDVKTFTTWRTITHPDDTPANQKMLTHCIKTGAKFDREYRIITKDTKEIKWLHGIGEIVFKEGKPANLVGTIQDITKNKLTELVIEESERKLREAQEITRLGTFIFDDSTNLFETSPICDDILGLDHSYKRDIKGWVNLLYPDDYVNVRKLLDSSKLKTISKEFRIIQPKDKKIIWILGKAKKEFDAKGNRRLITGTIQDITDRKKAEEKLRQSDAILNRINTLVLVANGKGDITYASPSIETILGYNPKDVLGQGWWQLTFTDIKLLNRIKKTIREYHSSKEPMSIMTNLRKIKTKEGVYKYIEWYVSKGGDNAIIAIGIDVTERQHEANVKEVFHKISKFANDAPNLDKLLPYVRKTLHNVIDTTNFFIALYNGRKDSFSIPFRVDEEDTSRDDYLQDFKKGKTLSGYVFDTQKTLLSTSSMARKLYKKGIIKEGGVKSKCWLGTPLIIENKAIGVMVVQSYTNVKAFSKDDMALLELVAANISLVVKKSRDYEQIRLLNQALIQSPESVVVTNKNGIIEFVNPAFTKLSGYKVEEVIGQTPSILKSGDQTDEYYLKLWDTLTKGDMWEGEFVNKRKDGTKYLVQANISSIKDREGKITNYIAVEEDITEKRKLERDFIHAFIDAQEQEKQSFGEDLHDGISQILAAESMFIQVLLKQNKDILDAKSLKQLERVREFNLSAINEARNIAHGLMSKQLKEKGLLIAVENICIDYSETRNIEFQFKTKGLKESEINKEIKTNIFRLTQEISTNIIRHSGANKAEVSITKTPDNNLKLFIKDNGIGIDFEKIKREKTGAGLKNIERRVTLLNGKYNLESKKDKCTCFTITVPLENIQ
ncbi:MAG: PAS domain S-box protein [Flavobacteriaceae bacterium]